jgi:hypothetical protein
MTRGACTVFLFLAIATASMAGGLDAWPRHRPAAP